METKMNFQVLSFKNFNSNRIRLSAHLLKSTLQIIVAFFILSASMSAEAQKAIQLQNSQLVVVNNVSCGFIKQKWVPGIVQSNGGFISYDARITTLTSQYNRSTGQKRRRLKRSIDTLKKTRNAGRKLCAGAQALVNQNGGSTPQTPIPTPSSPTPQPTVSPSPTVQNLNPQIQSTLSTTGWDRDARSLRGNLESVYGIECLPNGVLKTVYGTNVYTDDTGICSAAVHAGLISVQQGGIVGIKIKPGQEFYLGSTYNGVDSRDYGFWNGSYVFVNTETLAELASRPVPKVSSTFTASQFASKINQSYTFTCAENVNLISPSVWGSDIYTSDSSICRAAVHAGVINAANGGTVTFKIISGQPGYAGTSRNGITTQSYGSYSSSYEFVR
jgi:hypothetical protein